MTVTTSDLRFTEELANSEQTMRRLPQAIFSFLQTVSTPPGTGRLRPRRTSISDLDGQDVSAALELRHGVFGLPSDLKLVPDRMTLSTTMQAAGFADCRSRSVGVDIACWSEPCPVALDEIAWRRVFTWIVGTDDRLTNISILEPPAADGSRIIGSYGYDADGIPGYGVLQIVATDDGCWQICDCWGDAVEADRIDHLATFQPQL